MKFYHNYLINSYIISNFLNYKNFIYLKNISIKVFFKKFTKMTYFMTFLIFSILTKTKSYAIKGLKNYKENKTDIKILTFIINKNKFFFVYNLIKYYLKFNKDSLCKLKKIPNSTNYLTLNKSIDDLYLDKIYETNSDLLNADQINCFIYFKNNIKYTGVNNFLFNIWVHDSTFIKKF